MRRQVEYNLPKDPIGREKRSGWLLEIQGPNAVIESEEGLVDSVPLTLICFVHPGEDAGPTERKEA